MTKKEALELFKFNNENIWKLLKDNDLLYETWEDFINQFNVYGEISDKQVITWKNPFA